MWVKPKEQEMGGREPRSLPQSTCALLFLLAMAEMVIQADGAYAADLSSLSPSDIASFRDMFTSVGQSISSPLLSSSLPAL